MQSHVRASLGRLQNSQPAASEEARTEQPSCRLHLEHDAADLLREVCTERFGSVEQAVAAGLALR